MATIVIQPDPTTGKDANVNQSAPDTNYGSDTYFVIKKNSSIATSTRGLVQFDLSSIPAGSVINSATFFWYLYNINLNALSIYFYRITQDWAENTVTWNNQPTYADLIANYNAIGTINAWESKSILTAVQNWFSGAWANQGMTIWSNDANSNAYVQYYSSDYLDTPSLRPYLTIDYTPPKLNSKLLMGVGV